MEIISFSGLTKGRLFAKTVNKVTVIYICKYNKYNIINSKFNKYKI